LISAEAGEIERRLQALEKRLNIARARASTNARDAAENLGDAIASALTGQRKRSLGAKESVGSELAAVAAEASGIEPSELVVPNMVSDTAEAAEKPGRAG